MGIKRLLAGLFLLGALATQGAFPPFEAFRGGGSVLVTTNKATGTVTITGLSTNQASTNLTVAANCYTTYGVDTNNTLSVSNAGVAGANAIYRNNGSGTYTQGIYKVMPDATYGYVLSNNSAALYGFDFLGANNVGDGNTWTDDLGGGGNLPISWWGPVTNCFTNVVGANGMTLYLGATSTNLYVSATLGNDTNAVRGSLQFKWRTANGVFSVARPGDVIEFEEGDYPFSSQILTLTNGVTLKGAGRGVTRLGTAGGVEERLRPRSEFKIMDLTFYGCLQFGEGPPDATDIITNAWAYNCDFIGVSDGVEADAWNNLEFWNCRMFANYDAFADWNVRPGGSNRVARLYGCDLAVTNTTFGTCHGISGGDSRIEMYGGSISVLNGHIDNNPVYLSVDTYRTNKSGSVLLSNVRIRSYSTNNNAPFVTNFNNLPVFLDNCTEERVVGILKGAGVGSYTNQWSDRFITITNVGGGTNFLVDTRSLTNALTAASEQGHRVVICDGGFNAGTSNIWIATVGNQKILATGPNTGPTLTNLSANGGCMAFRVVGTNWMPEAIWP